MPSFGAASSAHSVRVPLSTVPMPQYGNRTVWQDEGLRIQGFAGSLIAADRDAPPGLQVRFGAGEPWIPLGPGEVLWAPRHYDEVHVRVWMRGAGAPIFGGSPTVLGLRGGNAGAAPLSPVYSSRVELLGALSFSLYNAPIQAFAGSRQGNVGGLFFRASDLDTTDTTRSILLGNWFSAADLNAARWLVFEYAFQAVDLYASDFQRVALGATTAPYLNAWIRDPLDSRQQMLRVGACECYTYTSGGVPAVLAEHGFFVGRFSFCGPFAPWQSLDLNDAFWSPAGARVMGTTQAGAGMLSRLSLTTGDRLPHFAAATFGRVAAASPMEQNYAVSLRHQIAGYETCGQRQAYHSSLVMQILAGAFSFYHWQDPSRLASSAHTRNRIAYAAAANGASQSLGESLDGVLAISAGCSAGNSFTNGNAPMSLRLQEIGA